MAGLSAGVLLLIGVTACTSAPTAGPAPSTQSVPSTAGAVQTTTTTSHLGVAGPSGAAQPPAALSLPTGVTAHALPSASTIVNNLQKRKNIAVEGCKSTASGWGATGTASNTSAEAIDYKITIFFTTSHATAIASAVTTVKVNPRSTATWSAATAFRAADTKLCVLRGVA